jgi:hypothetical protein
MVLTEFSNALSKTPLPISHAWTASSRNLIAAATPSAMSRFALNIANATTSRKRFRRG